MDSKRESVIVWLGIASLGMFVLLPLVALLCSDTWARVLAVLSIVGLLGYVCVGGYLTASTQGLYPQKHDHV